MVKPLQMFVQTEYFQHRQCIVSKLWIGKDLNDLLNKMKVAFRSGKADGLNTRGAEEDAL